MAQCSADVGTLTADATPVALSDGAATISATPNGDSVIPTNYEATYVLTSGVNLVIEAASPTPSFLVNETGEYTIHILIAETTDNTDSKYLDLSFINFGTTTGTDVLILFATSGITGGVLDVDGAPITVLEEDVPQTQEL